MPNAVRERHKHWQLLDLLSQYPSLRIAPSGGTELILCGSLRFHVIGNDRRCARLSSSQSSFRRGHDVDYTRIQELTKKHEAEVAPLYARHSEINGIRKRASRAREELRETCADRELLAEYASVQEELNAAEHERATIAEEITKRERWIRQDEEKAETTPYDSERRRYQDRVETHREILVNWKAKLEPVDRSVDALQHRMANLETLLLEP